MSDHHPILEAFLKAEGPTPVISPLAEAMNGQIQELDPATGLAVLSFEPDARYLQGAGVIQGGIVAAMLDFSMALSAFAKLPPGRSVGTVSLTTHFLKPVLPGRHIARSRLDRLGGKLIFASAELFADGGAAPLATATAVMAITAL